MTRKVSTTNVTSSGGQQGGLSGATPSAQVVTVTRSHSDVTKMNGEQRHQADVSPWQVTPVVNDVKAPQPARRLHLTTEL